MAGFKSVVKFLSDHTRIHFLQKHFQIVGNGQNNIETLLKRLMFPEQEDEEGDNFFNLFNDMDKNSTYNSSDVVMESVDSGEESDSNRTVVTSNDTWDIIDLSSVAKNRKMVPVKAKRTNSSNSLKGISNTDELVQEDPLMNQFLVDRDHIEEINKTENLSNSHEAYNDGNTSLKRDINYHIVRENMTNSFPGEELSELSSKNESETLVQSKTAERKEKNVINIMKENTGSQRHKRSMIVRPSERGVLAKLQRESHSYSFPQKKKNSRKLSGFPGGLELQRRREFILQTLREFKKAHSSLLEKDQTTKEVLKIFADDLLHKLRATSSRSTRDSGVNVQSRVSGGPATGSCRVFNLTCQQLPPLSDCSGAAIGGCIYQSQLSFFKMPRFIVAASVTLLAVLSIFSVLVSFGIYRSGCKGRVGPDEETTDAEVTEMVQNGVTTNGTSNNNAN
ncbi:hypothetical protein SK128_024876 [Halocaridina rubra]|uniref:Uncharacterized protein n=1 Tax=Halocaridina rubra TaxID=373956 RepID=A0AAN9A213_HALRR